MKKTFILMIILVLLVTLPIANASARYTPLAYPFTAADSPSVISIWHDWAGPNLTVFKQVLNQYAGAYPGLTINLYHPDDMWAELDTAIPEGTGPDIIAWGNDIIGTLMANHQIIDLDQLGITNSWLTSTFEPAAAQGVRYKDKIWALPYTQEGIALVYNKDLVTPAYLPANSLDFGDLRNKAQAFYTATGKPLICNQGFPGGDAYHVAPVFFGFGVPSYVDEYGKVNVNSLQAISAAAWLATMPSLSPVRQDYGSCQDGLLNGRLGMWWTGPWAMAALNVPDFHYGIVPMGKPFVGIKTLMISSNAQSRGNAALALDITQYLTNTVNSKTIALANLLIPANTAALNDPEVQALPTTAGFGAAMNLGVPMSSSFFAACQWVPMGDAEAAIWNGSQTPTMAMNLAQDQIESCVFKLLPHVFLPLVSR